MRRLRDWVAKLELRSVPASRPPMFLRLRSAESKAEALARWRAKWPEVDPMFIAPAAEDGSNGEAR